MTPAQQERAGEYVLGLMEGAERTTFEQEMVADPELGRAVRQLAERMQLLDNTVQPATPRASLWAAIEAQLDKPSASVDAPPQPNVLQMRRQPRPPAWPVAMAASVLVAIGLGYWLGNIGPKAPQPVMVAVLVSEETLTPGAIVEAFDDDSIRLTPLEAFRVPEGRILEVWTLPDPETGPVSLGTLEKPRTIRLTGPDLPLPEPGQLYEITLEPAPGSPTGRPTGPILVKGFGKVPQL